MQGLAKSSEATKRPFSKARLKRKRNKQAELGLNLKADGIILIDERKEIEIFNYFASFHTTKNNNCQIRNSRINTIKRKPETKIEF